MKIALAVLVLIIGSWLASTADIPWGVAAWICTSIAAALIVHDIESALDRLGFAAVTGGMAVIFGVASAVAGGGVMDVDQAKFNERAQNLFLNSLSSMYGPLDENSRRVAEIGFRVCATQRHTDLADTSLALISAYYAPSLVSLSLGVTEAIGARPQKVSCMSSYQAFRELQPSVVQRMEREFGHLTQSRP